MTTWAHRFMAVPDANKATARALALQLAPPPSADGLWTVGCNASGTGTPTDWISSGLIEAQFASLLGDATNTFAAYQAAGGTTITLAQIQALYTACPQGTRIRSDLNYEGGGLDGLNALGLKLIQGTL